MLPRSYRLPANYRLKNPRTSHSPFFVLKFALSEFDHSRCSVIVSKKVDKRATKRNELRRTIIHTAAPVLTTMVKTYDMLFIVKPAAKAGSTEDIRQAIQETLVKEHLL